MEVVIHRTVNGPDACTGSIEVDAKHFGHSLEDVVRDLKADGSGKIPKQTAIPAGRYKVTKEMSRRFKRWMPYLNRVPFFTGILMHSGNTEENTEGCILVGYRLTGDSISPGTSRIAFDALYAKMEEAWGRGEEVWCDVRNEFKEGLK